MFGCLYGACMRTLKSRYFTVTFILVRILMFREVYNLNILVAVYFVTKDKAILFELAQQVVDVAVIIRQGFSLYPGGAIF